MLTNTESRIKSLKNFYIMKCSGDMVHILKGKLHGGATGVTTMRRGATIYNAPQHYH